MKTLLVLMNLIFVYCLYKYRQGVKTKKYKVALFSNVPDTVLIGTLFGTVVITIEFIAFCIIYLP